MKKGFLFVVLLLVSTSVFAQAQFRGSAKFVCGRAGGAEIESWAFAPGFYYTSLNVTNGTDQGAINGRKRFSVAHLSQKVGPYTGWVPWVLGPGQSMQVDCGDIYRQLAIPPGTFIDGFVHFVGDPFRYDVTGVYTVSDGGIIVSNDVEEITIR